MMFFVPKSTSINLRITPDFRAEIESLAQYHGLTMSSYAHSLLVKAVRREREEFGSVLPNASQSERRVHDKRSAGKIVGHISPGAPTRQDAQRMIDDAKIVEKYPRKRTIDHVEPVPDERIAYVRNLGELTDERKQKPIRRKAGRK